MPGVTVGSKSLLVIFFYVRSTFVTHVSPFERVPRVEIESIKYFPRSAQTANVRKYGLTPIATLISFDNTFSSQLPALPLFDTF